VSPLSERHSEEHQVVVHADADLFPQAQFAQELIESAGFDYVPLSASTARIPEYIAPLAVALLCSRATVDKSVIDGLSRCRVIVRLGAGLDNIDVDAARGAGIQVTHVPHYCADEVAEHTFALLFACERRIAFCDAEMRERRWPTYAELGPMRRVRGLRLGVVGFGRIGQRVASIGRSFGMEVIAHDLRTTPSTIGVECVSMHEVLATADVLSLHLPLTMETRHWLGEDQIAMLRPGVTLLNTGRGGLIDEDALFDGLQAGVIRAAGLDVFETEPHPAERLVRHPRVVSSPHSAALSDSALRELFVTGAEDAVAVLRGEAPQHPVETRTNDGD